MRGLDCNVASILVRSFLRQLNCLTPTRSHGLHTLKPYRPIQRCPMAVPFEFHYVLYQPRPAQEQHVFILVLRDHCAATLLLLSSVRGYDSPDDFQNNGTPRVHHVKLIFQSHCRSLLKFCDPVPTKFRVNRII